MTGPKGPWPWRMEYQTWLDEIHSDRVWTWVQWPLICVLRALARVWPHRHNWYTEPGWDGYLCVYCPRSKESHDA